MTTRVEKSIQVDQPVDVVYNQWTQFEEFPRFMGGVESVTQLDDRRLHWVAEIGGVRREWDATILEQVPDEKIAWAATDGATNAGAVYFAPAGAGQTQVRLSLEYAPEGIVEKIGDTLHLIERQAESDLERFKVFIEEQRSATGAWRGTVPGDTTLGTPGVEDAEASRGTSGTAGLSTAAKVAGAAVAAGVAAAAAATMKRSGASGDAEAPAADEFEDVPVDVVTEPVFDDELSVGAADVGVAPFHAGTVAFGGVADDPLVDPLVDRLVDPLVDPVVDPVVDPPIVTGDPIIDRGSASGR